MEDNDAPMEETQRIFDGQPERDARVDLRMRRLWQLLSEVGWSAPTDGTMAAGLDLLAVRSLTAEQFDWLERLLRDVAQERSAQVAIVRHGRSRPDSDSIPGPYRAPVASSVHMVVPS